LEGSVIAGVGEALRLGGFDANLSSKGWMSRKIWGAGRRKRMKIEKPQKPTRTERAARAYAKSKTSETPEASRVTPVASASVLGIPEAEFTPRVRDAIMTLMHEVERLRREVEQTRGRLDELARTADQDMLLPILNRRAFVRDLTRFTAFAARYGTPSSLIYFDLDAFKNVNDAHGHAAGDEVLRHFAELIQGQIRDTDVFARIGGDEFGVILAHVTKDQAVRKGASLSQAFKDNPPKWEGKAIPLTFSYGIYELRAGEPPDLAMKQADEEMYAQKRSRDA
jgi:diguanylate cyclase (GGDEF)-like protein